MKRAIGFLAPTLIFLAAPVAPGEALPFEREVIDPAIGIGYGLAIGDVDGDGKPDILIADKSQIAWYRNPDWKRFVMAENLNPRVGVRFLDNVCIAARDLDGDGKVEVAAGANWNPGETSDPEKSGSVHYLIRPEDPTARWKPVKLTHDPTVHRMHWLDIDGKNHRLVVLPLHGIGNKGGEGDPVRVLAYDIDLATGEATTELVGADMHKTHNFDIVAFGDPGDGEAAVVGGAEGVISYNYRSGKWRSEKLVEPPLSRGVGEVRAWRGDNHEQTFIAAIEPMHGNEVVVYRPPGADGEVSREPLDDSLNQGHALAIADVLGKAEPQVIAGWRNPDADKKVGIRIYHREDGKWNPRWLDEGGMACEDLKVADLDGDGKPEVIAAGRATKNVVIYWNKRK